MPVRQIGLRYRSVSGRIPMGPGCRSVAVESTLERDFALLQRFDPDVVGIEEQPVRIRYGKGQSYVPDFLVHYADPGRSPLLAEVKFSTDPILLSGKLETRFEAARLYARSQGWVFEVVTEVELRTPRLENATFLLPYRERRLSLQARTTITEHLSVAAKTVAALADETGLLPDIWTLVSRFDLITDFDVPLTMRSSLRLPEGKLP